MKKQRFNKGLTILAIGVLVSACGGGGGGDSESVPSGDSTNSLKVENKEYQSESLLASNKISLQRQACGLNGLEHDDDLATLSKSHANYLQYLYSHGAAFDYDQHSESVAVGNERISGSANPYFTGETVGKRRAASGFYPTLSISENVGGFTMVNGGGIVLTPSQAANNIIKNLLAAPYHLESLMEPEKTMTGTSLFAYTPYGGSVKNSKAYILVNSSVSPRSVIKSDDRNIFTYPCDGVTDTVTALWQESPSPVQGTGRNLQTDPIGQPIYVHVPAATDIKVSNVKIRDTKRNTNVAVQIVDTENDPHKGSSHQMDRNKAYILPITDGINSCNKSTSNNNCGLNSHTKYQVSFDVMIDNKEMQSKSFTFTTGETNIF